MGAAGQRRCSASLWLAGLRHPPLSPKLTMTQDVVARTAEPPHFRSFDTRSPRWVSGGWLFCYSSNLSSQPCPWRRVELRGFSHFERAVGAGTSARIPLTCGSRARAEGLGSRRPRGAPSQRARAGGARPRGLAYVLLSPVLSAAQGPLACGGGSPLGERCLYRRR
jgi:hypothetical protein